MEILLTGSQVTKLQEFLDEAKLDYASGVGNERSDETPSPGTI